MNTKKIRTNNEKKSRILLAIAKCEQEFETWISSKHQIRLGAKLTRLLRLNSKYEFIETTDWTWSH